MPTININTQPSYNIHIDSLLSCLAHLETQLQQYHPNHVICICDDNTHTIATNIINTIAISNRHILTIPPGECHKTRTQKHQLEDQIFKLGCARDTVIIAVGGGVVTDLAGFVAATFCRGIPAIYFPTSLLAMLDASIGGKTGVNTDFGKNLIGAFKQPDAVYICPSLLQSLPEREYRSGISEAIKHALIVKTPLLELLNNNSQAFFDRDENLLGELLYQSCLVKKSIVEQDSHEKGLREVLNAGHTIAHAIEHVSNHQINHGEAVAIGLYLEAKIAEKKQLLSHNDIYVIKKLLQRYQLPIDYEKLNQDSLIQAMLLDKKTRGGNIRFVLLEQIGKVFVNKHHYAHSVDIDDIKAALYMQ